MIEVSMALFIVIVGVGGYWIGWTDAKDEQREIELLDRLEKTAIEYGRQLK